MYSTQDITKFHYGMTVSLIFKSRLLTPSSLDKTDEPPAPLFKFGSSKLLTMQMAYLSQSNKSLKTSAQTVSSTSKPLNTEKEFTWTCSSPSTWTSKSKSCSTCSFTTRRWSKQPWNKSRKSNLKTRPSSQTARNSTEPWLSTSSTITNSWVLFSQIGVSTTPRWTIPTSPTTIKISGIEWVLTRFLTLIRTIFTWCLWPHFLRGNYMRRRLRRTTRWLLWMLISKIRRQSIFDLRIIFRSL